MVGCSPGQRHLVEEGSEEENGFFSHDTQWRMKEFLKNLPATIPSNTQTEMTGVLVRGTPHRCRGRSDLKVCDMREVHRGFIRIGTLSCGGQLFPRCTSEVAKTERQSTSRGGMGSSRQDPAIRSLGKRANPARARFYNTLRGWAGHAKVAFHG